MSCFWDTLLSRIKKDDIQSILSLHNHTPKDFANTLKSKNISTDNILWMGEEVTQQMKEENIEHVKEYDSSTIPSGYLCSTCDPFLLLITELFQIKIIHHYNKTIINYQHKENNKYTITIHNNKGHMW
tara:strand:+ start:1789 stop:2172 length:384 start_codon:yes stop_codon:yes gene_type:complete